jgi:hypothetical protein
MFVTSSVSFAKYKIPLVETNPIEHAWVCGDVTGKHSNDCTWKSNLQQKNIVENKKQVNSNEAILPSRENRFLVTI